MLSELVEFRCLTGVYSRLVDCCHLGHWGVRRLILHIVELIDKLGGCKIRDDRTFVYLVKSNKMALVFDQLVLGRLFWLLLVLLLLFCWLLTLLSRCMVIRLNLLPLAFLFGIMRLLLAVGLAITVLSHLRVIDLVL